MSDLRDFKNIFGNLVGALSFSWGSTHGASGVPKYQINEFTDILWGSDLRFGATMVGSGLVDTDLNPDAEPDQVTAYTSYAQLNYSGSVVSHSTLSTYLFDGDYNSRIDLEVDSSSAKTHKFIILLRNHAGTPSTGIDYPEGKFYVSFYATQTNFSYVKLRVFNIPAHATNGTWQDCGDTITSKTDSRNISAPHSGTGDHAVLAFDVPNTNNLAAFELTIEVPAVPGFDGSVWTDRCSPSTINYYSDRISHSQNEIPYVSKYRATNRLYGPLLHGDGIASAPTISFISSDNTGMYYDNSGDNLRVVSGGADAVQINSSGDVTKLGQDTPVTNEVLTWDGSKAVWGGVITCTNLYVEKVLASNYISTGGYYAFNHSSGSLESDVKIEKDTDALVFRTGSSESARIDADGFLGMGTTSPSWHLDILSTGNESAQIALRNTSTGRAGIFFDASNGDIAGGDYAWAGQLDNLNFDLYTESNAGDIHLRPKGGAGAVYIAGKLGIGVGAPTKKLEVSGDIVVSGTTKLNNVEYTWPTADGGDGQHLKTNGSGVLAWVNAGSSGGLSITAATDTLDDEDSIWDTHYASSSGAETPWVTSISIPAGASVIGVEISVTEAFNQGAGTHSKALWIPEAGKRYCFSGCYVSSYGTSDTYVGKVFGNIGIYTVTGIWKNATSSAVDFELILRHDESSSLTAATAGALTLTVHYLS